VNETSPLKYDPHNQPGRIVIQKVCLCYIEDRPLGYNTLKNDKEKIESARIRGK
jgi:hypothetical protein